MVEWFDTLITEICGPTESASPLVKTHEIQQPAPPSTTSLDASTTYMPSGEHTREDMLLSMWLQSASTKKFAVHLVQHCFLLQRLDGCNGRGIGNKLTLDPVKMEKTRK